jgi:hypothetical protein
MSALCNLTMNHHGLMQQQPWAAASVHSTLAHSLVALLTCCMQSTWPSPRASCGQTPPGHLTAEAPPLPPRSPSCNTFALTPMCVLRKLGLLLYRFLHNHHNTAGVTALLGMAAHTEGAQG